MLSPFCNFVSCDVETGGLPNKNKRAVYDVALTEVALVLVTDDLQITKSGSWLIKPYKDNLEYNPEAAKVSGITRQMCEERGVDIFEAHKEIVYFLKAAKIGKRAPVIFGHNFIKFDGDFMINLFEFCKDDITNYVQAEPEDTIKWSRLAWKESVNYKLGTCCENAGITLQDAHRAMTDTIATAKLWIHFMNNLRGSGQQAIVEPSKKFRHVFEF